MTKFGGWAAGVFGVAAIVLPGISSAQAASLDDMNACRAVGSTAVRLACFDAAAKGITDGDIATCAKVGSESVRLACFDAAAGTSPKTSSAAAPAASASRDMDKLDAEMRAREAAMRARIEELQRKAAEVERRTAEIERKTAAVNKKSAGTESAEPANPVEAFGSKYLGDEPQSSDEKKFGNLEAESGDPLTAKSYGKASDGDEDNDDEKKGLKRIAVEITNIHEGPYGKITVTLSNGQVWKQIDSARARWNEDGKNVANIRRALFGSFLMRINDEGAALRVRRVE